MKKEIFPLLISLLILGAFLWCPARVSSMEEKEKTLILPLPLEEEEAGTEVTITIYHPVPSETDNDPLETADQSIIPLEDLREGAIRWVAVSRDLLGEYNYGDIIEVDSPGHPEISGLWEIHDTMNKRFTKRIDLLVSPDDPFMGKFQGTIKKVH